MIDPVTGIDYPFFQNQLMDMFGEPNEGQFAREYLVSIDLREFADALGHVLNFEGNPWGHRIYGNYIMEGPLRKAFGLIVSQGLAGEIHSFDGCFAIRRMRGGRSMSVHSWGLALDFNAGTNPFGQEGDMSPELIKCFADSGWESGMLWHKPDFMHVQICWTADWRKSDHPLRPIPYQP